MEDMNRIVLEIAKRAGVRKVIKSKSMLGEESGLNRFLEQGVSTCARLTWASTSSGVPDTALAHHRAGYPQDQDEIAALFEEKHGTPRKHEIAAMTREARG